MKISKCSSDLLKTAIAPVSDPGKEEGVRNNKQIADAIASAATAMGLVASVHALAKYGQETSYIVYCDGRKNEIQIKYVVNAYGDMDAMVYPKTGGGRMFEGSLKLMREIVANAVRDSGIAALPIGRKVDMPLAMDPNIYRQQAVQRQAPAQAQPQVQPQVQPQAPAPNMPSRPNSTEAI